MNRMKPNMSLLRDNAGATMLEFALLAPMLIAMTMGIFSVGLQMHDSAALRSVASDMSRYAVIEYQRENKMNAAQIRNVAAAMASRPPYALNGNQLDVTVTEETSPIAGARMFTLTLTYEPFNPLKFYNVLAPTLTHEQNIYVPA